MKSQLASAIFVFLSLTFRSKDQLTFYAFWSVLALTTAYLCATRMRLGSAEKLHFFKSWSGFSISLFIWVLVCATFAPDYSEHLKYAAVFAGYLFSSIFLCWEYKKLAGLDRDQFAMQTMAWWTASTLILFMLHYLGILTPRREDDFAGLLSDRNAFAVTAAFFCIVSLYAAQNTASAAARRRFYFMVLLNGGVIAATGSITGLLVYVVGWGPFLLSRLTSTRPILAIAVLAAVLALNSDALKYRIERFSMALMGDDGVLLENESAFKRPYMIAQGLQLTLRHPIFGVGFEGARHHYKWPSGEEGAHLHANFLDISTSIGIPGLFIFYWPLLKQLLRRNRLYKLEVLGLGLSKTCGVSILFMSMTYTWYIDFIPVLIFVFAASNLGAVSREK